MTGILSSMPPQTTPLVITTNTHAMAAAHGVDCAVQRDVVAVRITGTRQPIGWLRPQLDGRWRGQLADTGEWTDSTVQEVAVVRLVAAYAALPPEP